MDNEGSLMQHAERLGALIKDIRVAAGKNVPECANSIGVTEDVFQAYETGDASPSLPEVEMLAYFLQVPLEHFWGNDLSKLETERWQQVNPQVLLGLRHRLVGALLRKARLDTDLGLEALSQQTGIAAELIQDYELGVKPVPMTELDALAAALGYSLRHFQDQRGPIGAWMLEQRAMQDFRKLPPELQAFIVKPVNRPYLEMAQRLSEMSVEKLRAVAEGLLEITL